MPRGPRRWLRLRSRTAEEIEAEVLEEFEFHIRARVDELVAQGATADEARDRATAEFGDAARARAYCRRVDLSSQRARQHRERWAELWLDLVYLFRGLARAPLAAGVIATILGIGLGANLLAVAFADELLFRQLPVADPERLVLYHEVRPGTEEMQSIPIADFHDLRRDAGRVTELAAFNGRNLALSTGGRPMVVPAQFVSANYFGVLGVVPALGRFTRSEEDHPGSAVVAVISHRLWAKRFGGAPDVVGTSIRVNGQPATIVGVAPPGFFGLFIGFHFDLYLPLGSAPAIDPAFIPSSRTASLELFGRLRPGVERTSADRELTRLANALPVAGPPRQRVMISDPVSGFDTELRPGVVALAVSVVTLASLGLSVAALNGGGLLLARGLGRHREFALRQSLGAGRFRLVRLQLLEAAILVGLGTGVGAVVLVSLRSLVNRLLPTLPLPVALDLAIDLRLGGFAVLLALVSTLLIGLGPAMTTTSGDLAQRIRGPSGPAGGWLRRAFLSGQVAISFALLVGAGLLTRGLAVVGEGQGRAEPVITLAIDYSFASSDRAAARRFFDDLAGRLRTAPGVTGVGYAATLPFGFGAAQAVIRVPGLDPPVGEAGHHVAMNRISPRLLETVGINLARGRDFTAADRDRSDQIVLINEPAARRFFAGTDPVGSRLEVSGQPAEIVGVVDDSRFALAGSGRDVPRLYLSSDQANSPRAILLVRGGGPGVGEMVFQTVSALAPDLPINPIGTLAENRALAFLPQRLLGGATGIIAALTILLATLGLYGLLASWVASREVELGVRSALGVGRRSLVTMVIRQGLAPIGYGIMIGACLAAGLGLVLRRFLLGVSPFDPPTYLAVTAIFYSVAALACLVPALRASRIDPIVALRS